MKQQIVLLIIISFLSTSCAMTNKTTLYFNDGTQKTGVGKLSNSNYVKFQTEGTKPQKYYFDSIKLAQIQYGQKTKNYVYIKVKGEIPNYKVVDRIKEGRINLYNIHSESYNAMNGQSFVIDSYYVQRENEKEATHLGSTHLFSIRIFRDTASEYFSDCPLLSKKIKEKEFDAFDMLEIIKYYENSCK